MGSYLKRKLGSIAQRMAILVWMPCVLVMSNCGGEVELKPLSGADSVNNDSQTQTFDEIIVFCGNPGVGKSSLCNSIFQKAEFESGLSIGEGMTKKKQEYIYENRKYIDTPGLADVKTREEAAKEIESALKGNNNYKIVFVALLDAGKVRADDLTTINTVCDAINTSFEYGIIFNKVSRQVSREIGKPDSLNEYLAQFHKQPASTIIISKESSMDDENNIFLPYESVSRQKLIEFISSNIKAHRIGDNQVLPLDVRDYEEKFKEIEAKFREAEALRVKKEDEIEQKELVEQVEQEPLGNKGTGNQVQAQALDVKSLVERSSKPETTVEVHEDKKGPQKLIGQVKVLNHNAHTQTTSGIVDFIVQTRKKVGFEQIPDFHFHHQDLNEKNRGDYVYIGWKIGVVNENTPLVTSVDFKAFDEEQNNPVGGWEWCPKNINSGAGGRFIYLHFKKGEQNKIPIQALDFSSPMDTSTPPDKGDDWKLIPQNLCEGCSSMWRVYTARYIWAYYTRKPQE